MFHFYSIFDHLYFSIYITNLYLLLLLYIGIFVFYIGPFVLKNFYYYFIIFYFYCILLHFYSIFDHLYLPSLHYYSIRFRFYCTRCMFIFNLWSISILCAKPFILCNLFIYFVTSDFNWLFRKSVKFPALIGSPHTAARRIRKLR